MRVNYLGPLLVSNDHPAIQEMPVSDLPETCFLVEVSPEAGVDGELIEGDVLVADENRVAAHGDLVLARDEQEQMRAYHSHRVGPDLRLMPVGGGQAVTATVLDYSGVVVRRSRYPANDVEPAEIVDQTLADAFAPWFSLPTWSTPNPADARRFHDCCRSFFDANGGRVKAGRFIETMRVAIPQRHGGRWDDYCERALQHRAQCVEAISDFLLDTFQIAR